MVIIIIIIVGQYNILCNSLVFELLEIITNFFKKMLKFLILKGLDEKDLWEKGSCLNRIKPDLYEQNKKF